MMVHCNVYSRCRFAVRMAFINWQISMEGFWAAVEKIHQEERLRHQWKGVTVRNWCCQFCLYPLQQMLMDWLKTVPQVDMESLTSLL